MISEIFNNIIIGPPGRYNVFSLEIEIDGRINSKSNPTIFHEYTHYLQNMTTINGFIELDKYIHVLLTTFTKLGSESINPRLPLKYHNELQSVLGDKNVENIIKKRLFGMEFDSSNKMYTFQDTNLDDYSISEQEHFDFFSGLSYIIPYIAIDDKNIPINDLTIKENMALVNSIIGNPEFRSLTKNDINEIISFEHKEYTILFDFINNYLPNCDLLKLVYSICEIGLNINFSELFVGNILRLIQEEYEEMAKMKTDDIIYLIKEKINYDKIFMILYNITCEQAIKVTMDLFNQFDPSENQFVSIMNNFYHFLIKGLEFRATQKTLYVNRLTNDYVQNLTAVIGCPIIFFKEEKEYKGFSETPEYFFSDFTYLHGSLIIFRLLYECEIFLCPFIDRNICKIKKNKKCYEDCLSNYNDELYSNCLLSNTLNCTGIRQERRRQNKV